MTDKKHNPVRRDKKEKKCTECEKYLAGWKRALADYENLTKQTQKEKEAFVKFANLNLIMHLIPVYENFKIALEHAPKDDDWTKGVEHIRNQFKKVLEDNNVSEIVPKPGDKFNPQEHEAVEGSSKDGDKIEKVVSVGYKLHDKVFVPVRVIVK